MADADAVLADLVSGAYDDQIPAFREALDLREKSGEVEVAWSVTFGDFTVDKTHKRGNGITIGAVLKLDNLGRRVGVVDPMRSEPDRLAVVLAYIMARDDLDLDGASKKIGEQRYDEIHVSEYVEHDIPKDV